METYFDITDVTYDLEPSAYMTEYEEKKRVLGPIYQLKGKVKQDDSKDL
jgi:tRNA (guanine-N7-)-methyltransferase